MTEKSLREQFHTEEAHRIRVQVDELKEQILEYRSLVNLESYIGYFYQERSVFASF